MIQAVWAWLTGYVIVKFRGPEIELLLNRMIESGMTAWGVERIISDIIVARLSVRSFHQLRPMLWGLRVNVSIVGRVGLPFAISKLRRRQFLWIGMVLFVIGLQYLSGFIWFIQIEGNEFVSNEEIFAIVLGEGLHVGLPKKDFSARKVEIALLTELDDIVWAGINLKGSLVKIQVVERSTPDQERLKSGMLVAARDALVTQVLAFRGTPQVQVGATVHKGEPLILGTYYDIYGRRQEGRAEGVVLARVWYEGIGEAAYNKITQQRTGNTHIGYVIEFRERQVAFNQDVPFTLYQVEKNPIFHRVGGYHTPIKMIRHIYHELVYETMVISRDEAKETALARAWDHLKAERVSQDKVLESQIEEFTIEDQHGIRVELLVEVEEDIAEFKPTPEL